MLRMGVEAYSISMILFFFGSCDKYGFGPSLSSYLLGYFSDLNFLVGGWSNKVFRFFTSGDASAMTILTPRFDNDMSLFVFAPANGVVYVVEPPASACYRFVIEALKV